MVVMCIVNFVLIILLGIRVQILHGSVQRAIDKVVDGINTLSKRMK